MTDQRPPDEPIEKTIIEHLAEGVYYVDPDRMITYWNRGAGRITGHPASTIVGRHCFDNILDHVDGQGNSLCHSTCPLAATLRDGEPREVSIWLKHREGHRKPVRVRTMPVRNDAGQIVGAVETFSDNGAVLRAAEDAERARRDSLTDELTGLPNRRFFDTALAGRVDNLARYGWGFGLLIADLDDFKAINDRYGHVFGDRVLAGVARTIHGAVRAGDSVARWGGDEFAILVEPADEPGLREAGERVRMLVSRSENRSPGGLRRNHVTIGGALARAGEPSAELFARADAALYRAKTAGRNRVEIDPPDGAQ